MPGPAVYAVAVVSTVAALVAFHEFVYEPHIAPRIEAWAVSFVEGRRRRRRQRQGPIPVPAHPTHENGDENRARRSSDHPSRSNDLGASVELEELVATEVNEWRGHAGRSSLRHRRTASAMDDDESNSFIPYTSLSPTHVLFDSSAPTSPLSPSGDRSGLSSPVAPGIRAARGPSVVSRASPRPQHSARLDSPAAPSPRLPTPISNVSPSLRALTPTLTDVGSHRSFPSSRASSPDVHMPESMYNTAFMSDSGHTADDMLSVTAASSRSVSPFSDGYSAIARSPTIRSPMVLSPHSDSDLELSSDGDDDVLSLRSGMFSPGSGAREVHFDVRSHDGSEAGWASVGRRSPDL
ncbi:hypothetical protein B0H21DRAFT_699781 [Amylocystis lapponica]|nr:hypothetical protein B0H21DRAFT_699781 [Amylocystis lapponica]